MVRSLFQIALFVFLFPIFIFFQETETSLFEQGDAAYKANDHKAALDIYQKILAVNPNNFDANWKVSRAFVDIGEDLENDDERAEYYNNSEKYARASIKSDPLGSNGHLYLSIALGRVALDAGAKQRIQMSKEIKKEADLAVLYDAQSDLAYHVLGRWNRKISNLSWIEKGFADMFLGGVPKNASNEAAISNFKKSIELSPSYINHYLELGITYEIMGNTNEAIKNFKKCIEITSSNPKDKKRKATAQEYLDELK